jgi:hypothetical protein
VTLERLVITFKSEELDIHALYITQDGPSPETKARTRVVANLAREGLRQALAALEDRPIWSVRPATTFGRLFFWGHSLTRCRQASEESMTWKYWKR